MMLIKLNDKGVRVYLATSGASYHRARLDWQTEPVELRTTAATVRMRM
jgi:hypothetical protein